MAKYPGTYSTKDVCKAEVAECKAILKRYHVSPEDIETITGMIKQAYHMLEDSYSASNAMEAYAEDELGSSWSKDFFAKWMSRSKKPGKRLKEHMDKEQEEYEKELRKRENFKVVSKNNG